MSTTFKSVINNGTAELASGIDSSTLTIPLAAGDGANLPASGAFWFSLDDEILLIASRSTDTLTATSRGQQGTSAAAHDAGTVGELRWTKSNVDEITAAINAIENGTVTLTQVKLGDDTGKLIFGNDSDIQFLYDETTDDRLEITDGTNTLAYLKDLGTTGMFGVTGRAEIPQIGISADTDLLTLTPNLLTLAGDMQIDGATNNAGLIVGTSGVAQNRYIIVNAPLGRNRGYVIRTAGTDSWYIYSAGSSTEYRVGTLTADVLKMTQAGVLSLTQGGSTDFFKVGGIVFVSTTSVGNVGAGEDNLISHAVAAATLTTDGQSLWFEAAFTFAANANSKRVKIYFGATAIFDSGAQIQNGGSMVVRGRIPRTGAATQIAYTSEVNSGVLFGNITSYTTPAETLANAITLKATGEGVADNDIVNVSLIIGFDPANT